MSSVTPSRVAAPFAWLAVLLLHAPAAAQDVRTAEAGRPLTLAAAIGEALGRSPALRPAEDAIEIAAIRQTVAASRFGLKMGPTFTAGSDALGTMHRRFGFTAAKRMTTGTQVRIDGDWLHYGAEETPYGGGGGVTVAVTQPLLRGLGPAITAPLRDAERATVTSERSLEEARRNLILVVAGAYYGAVRQQRLVESGGRALERAVALRRASEARTRVGLATKLDVLRADLLVSESQAHVDRQRELLADSLDQLKVLMGRPLDAAIALPIGDVAAGSPVDVTGTSDTLDSLIASALSRRLDVREARDRIVDAERTAAVSRWNLLPQVDLTVAYTKRGFGGDVFGPLLDGWRFGLTTSYPLDRAAEAAAAGTAKIATRAARRALTDLEQQAAADVRRAWRARERAGAGIEIQTKAVALARQQLKLAEMRYQRGVAGNFDVIDAESNLFRAESALITAETERALAELALQRAAGTLDPSRYLP